MQRVIGLALIFLGMAAAARAEEIGYVEDFALAKDRTAALAQLIPGTEDYYYYHCLHYQNLEQFDKVEQLLASWIKRYNYTGRVKQIENRQALLTYANNSQASLDFLRKRLNLQFNHQREQVGRVPDLPEALDQRLISRETLTAQALARYQNLQGFEDTALDWLISTNLDPERRRHLLERLARPDYANLPKLVVDDLDYRYSKGFGSFKIHRQLLLSQLDECLRLKSDLLNQTNFVNTYLTKLQPNPDVDWKNDFAEHAAYLDRLWKFVDRLAPVHNSLKAHVVYHRLLLDRSRGVYDKDRFMTYIKLPRQTSYINAEYMKLEQNRRYPANLNQDFSAVTLMPPVGDDEPLLRSYLHYYFVDEATYKPYEPYINDIYLKHNFAETKIVNGLGEPERWYSMLPPDLYQRLKERIDLDFAFTNQRVFADDEPVGLDLSVKNVKTLLIKVYEINTKNYYRENRREVNADINLDGLVANVEETRELTEPPIRRVTRRFDFPQLKKPGVYVIDFIGNGRSSRVVVRKGKLRYLVRNSTAGQIFTVLDDNNKKLENATLWMEGHEYKAGEDGAIVTPFTHRPGRQPIILSAGEFSSLAHVQHRAENYQLRAGIFVDRESLLQRKKAQVLVRPGLYLEGTPVTLSVLEEPRLLITSVDQDGVSTTQEVNDFQLSESRESLHEFQVPARLAQISFTLSCKVKNLSQNKKQDLSVQESFSLNGINKTDKVEDLHFMNVDGSYVVELLGRSGEARADRPITLTIKHRDFLNPVNVTMKTDQRGRIALGALADIVSVTATGPEKTTHTWPLLPDQHTYLASMNGSAGQAIQLAYMGPAKEPARSEFSLLELRGGTYAVDRFAALSIRQGSLSIDDLPSGDYDLLLKRSGQRVRLQFAAGPQREGYVLGTNRLLEVRGEQPLQIDSIVTEQDQITVQLRHATQFARLHVFATRYQPAYSAFAHLARVRNVEPFQTSAPKLESLYAQGRNIGDEYRYILERRYAEKFPGNMLDRPSLLLNPWAIRSTETAKQLAAEGDEFAPTEDAAQAYGGRAAGRGGKGGEQPGGFANLNFLAHASALLLNLEANEKGVVTIPRDQIGPHQSLHFVAVDPRTTASRSLSLPDAQREFEDLRLLAGLDPEKHFTQQKQISIVRQEQQFKLPDIATSKFEVYDTLARVYALYMTLNPDPKLTEFGFVLDWPTMTPEQKQEKYSKYACHELNFFLFKKDPEFFKNVVHPYLQNKMDKTFLDRWLVGEELRQYLQPWNFEQLNTVERILLAQRIQNESSRTSTFVRNAYDLIPPDINRFNFLFDTAIKGNALDASVSDFEAAKEAASVEMKRKALKKLSVMDAPARAGAARPAAPPVPRAPAEKEESAAKASVNRALQSLARRQAAGADKADAKKAPASRRSAGRDQNGADDFFGEDRGRRLAEVRQLYQQLDKTKEWVENNYYQLAINDQNSELITVNAFWVDYAAQPLEQPFYSTRFADASRNFPEMMFALSLLDIPFKSPRHETRFDKAEMTIKAAAPMLVFHEEIRPAGDVAQETPILVSQNFFRLSDRYRFENNQRYDKFVSEEFLISAVYGCQIVITNPTSSPQKLDLLLQIPVGSLPVMNGQYTKSVQLDLQPFNTQTVEYHFYFPSAGDFAHYPVQVAKNEELLASGEPFRFHVVDKLSKIDTDSWAYISQFGSPEQVIEYLDKHNLQRTNLEKIAFRMQDKAFFLKTIELLTRRHIYNHTLWSYGVLHNDPNAVREYLQHSNAFVAECGDYLQSPLLTIDPVARKSYEFRDYKPLVNARAHQLGKRRQILNNRFHQQYHQLLKILSYRRELTDDQLMSVTNYMLLQDRVQEAFAFFARVNRQKLASQLQYDYFTAYLSFYTEDQQLARDLSNQYANYPVERWRNAFAAIASQLDTIQGQPVELVDDEDRSQRQEALADTEPNFEFTVESKKVRVNYQQLTRLQVNYYLMDIELMFSTTPFVQQYGDQFSFIQPNGSATLELPAGKTSLEFQMPLDLHNRNILVEIIGAGQTKTQTYFSNSLALQVIENYGRLRVALDKKGTPVPKVYVKVYARLKDGSVKFYKDGYTDLRGRFDYASLNTNELEFVEKFSILVLSDEYGAIIREANPPKE